MEARFLSLVMQLIDKILTKNEGTCNTDERAKLELQLAIYNTQQSFVLIYRPISIFLCFDRQHNINSLPISNVSRCTRVYKQWCTCIIIIKLCSMEVITRKNG